MPDFPTLPPIAAEPISVVLLAHNAEPCVEEVVGAWVGFLNGLGRDYELLLVDDRSTDRTAELAVPLAERNPRVRLLRHAVRQGEGAALRTGLAAARHPLLAHAPCDLQYRPDELKRLLAEIDRAHVVSGFRAHRAAPLALRALDGLGRGLARWVFAVPIEKSPGWLGWRELFRRLLARVFFGVRLRDVGCAFRLFRRSIFARIPIQSEGPFVHVEVLAKANFLTSVMTETPVSHAPTSKAPTAWALAEAYRVFSRPDFGPPLLPGSEGSSGQRAETAGRNFSLPPPPSAR